MEAGVFADVAGLTQVSDSTRTHPNPYNDVGLAHLWDALAFSGKYQDWVFGFETIQHYLNWFLYEWGREAIAKDAALAVYEVPDMYIHLGQFQIMAHRGHIKHLHDLNTFTLEQEHFCLCASQEANKKMVERACAFKTKETVIERLDSVCNA